MKQKYWVNVDGYLVFGNKEKDEREEVVDTTNSFLIQQKYIEPLTKVFNNYDALLDALQGLFNHCCMTHKHWGDGNNQKEADRAIKAAKAAIAQAEKEGGAW